MRIKPSLLLTLAIISVTTTSVFAATDDSLMQRYRHPYQFFVGGSIMAGYSSMSKNDLSNRVNNPALQAVGNQVTSLSTASPLLYDIELGLMTSTHFGIDLAYFYKPNKINMDIVNQFTQQTGSASMNLNMTTVGMIADFDIKPKLAFIGKLGIALIRSNMDFDQNAQKITKMTSIDATMVSGMASVGLDYVLTPQLILSGSYMHVLENKNPEEFHTTEYGTIGTGVINPALDTLGVGLKYYF